MNRPDGHRVDPRVLWFVAGLAAFLGVLLVSLARTPPESLLDVVLIVASAGCASVTVATAYFLEADRGTPPGDGAPSPGYRAQLWRALRVAGRAALVLGLVTGVALLAGPPAAQLAKDVWFARFGCPSSTELRWAVAQEVRDVAEQLGEAFERSGARDNGGCPVAVVSVFEANADEVVGRLGGVGEWSFRSGALLDGPQPDIVLTGPVPGVPLSGTGAVRDVRTVATSPVVIAVPEGSQLADDADRTWTEAIEAAENAALAVVAPDLRTTTTGQVAAVLTTMSSPSDDDGEVLAELERRVARTRADYGFPMGGTAEVLCHLRDPSVPAARTAVIATELDVIRANREALLVPCRRDRESRPLAAMYPIADRGLDVQLISTAWTGQGERQRTAADALVAWVSGDEGAAVLAHAGLRPEGSELVPTDSMLDPPPLPHHPSLTDPELEAGRELLERVQLSGRVLFAVDTSGSMAALASDGTRLAAVVRAVGATFDLAGDDDQLGLWLFPDATRTRPARVVDIGPVGDTRTRARDELDRAVADGDTPLFQTVADGVAAVRSDDPQVNELLVVVTDGEDTTSRIGAEDVVRSLGTGVPVVIVTLGEVRCNAGTLGEIVGASRSLSCEDADPSTLEDVLDNAVRSVWSAR